jgi:hypothetical protein
MADQNNVGGVKLESNTFRNADGSFESVTQLSIRFNPEEFEGALVAGRKVVGALLTHFAECKSMAEGFAKLFELGVTKAANDNVATAAPTPVTQPGDDVTGGTQVTKGDSDVELQVNGDGNVEVVAKVDDTQQQQ